MKKKICKIYNGEHSYMLEVDGLKIPFQTHAAVTYFIEHYKRLGYIIEFPGLNQNAKNEDKDSPL